MTYFNYSVYKNTLLQESSSVEGSMDTLAPCPFSLFIFLLFQGRRSLALARLSDLKTSLQRTHQLFMPIHAWWHHTCLFEQLFLMLDRYRLVSSKQHRLLVLDHSISRRAQWCAARSSLGDYASSVLMIAQRKNLSLLWPSNQSMLGPRADNYSICRSGRQSTH